MQILEIESFLKYFEGIRRRTLAVAACIPREKIEWSYQAGKFTFGDILRHLGAIERYMFAENARGAPSRYPGHSTELAEGSAETRRFLDRMHGEAVEIFSALSPADLQEKCVTPADTPITVWKWLRAMVEHEVHHRGQLYLYLAMLDISTPPLYGLTSEQVRAGSVAESPRGG